MAKDYKSIKLRCKKAHNPPHHCFQLVSKNKYITAAVNIIIYNKIIPVIIQIIEKRINIINVKIKTNAQNTAVVSVGKQVSLLERSTHTLRLQQQSFNNSETSTDHN